MPEAIAQAETATASAVTELQVVPQSVISRRLANPFLAPDFSAVASALPVRDAWPAGNSSARC